jgi:glutamate decarboxylase
MRGWLLPAYTFPADLQDTAVIRIVVRNGFSQDLAQALLDDLRLQVKALASHPQPPVPLVPASSGPRHGGFAH